jgi:RHS repeat-associated protein
MRIRLLAAFVGIAILGLLLVLPAGYGPDTSARAAAIEPLASAGSTGPRAVTLTATGDTYVRDGAPNQSQSGESLLRLRSSGRNRALVRFDHEDLAEALAGNALVSAYLEVFVQGNGGNWGEGRTVDAHRLTTSWGENAATWNCPVDSNLGNHQPDCAAPWDGGDFEATATSSVVHTNDLAGWVRFDVTPDLEAAMVGAPFFGWQLKKTNEGAPGLVDYSSREVCGEEPRLVLEIESPGPDFVPPRLTITSPADRFLINQPSPGLEVAFFDAGSSVDLSSLEVELDGTDLTSTCSVCQSRATCPSPVLAEGSHTLTARLADASGNSSTTSFAFDLLLGDGEHRLTLPAVGDTYLRDGAPNQNEGDDTLLRIRSSGKNRALVRFDLDGVEELVDDFYSATLELYLEHNGNNWGPSGRTIDAHALATDWTESGATWNCPDDSEPTDGGPDCPAQWNGGAFDADPTDTLVVTNGLTGWVPFEVTADVLAALAGEPHHGWLLKKSAENQSGLAEFSSREGTPGQTARLVLVFEGGDAPDLEPPSLAIAAPAEGALLNDPLPELGFAFSDDGSGVDTATLAVQVGGSPLAVSCAFTETTAACVPVEPLADGPEGLSATIADQAGNVSAPAGVLFTIDTVPPAAVDPGQVTVSAPAAGSATVSAPAGSAETGAEVRITNVRTGASITLPVGGDGSFGGTVEAEADDVLSLVVIDGAGNQSAASEVVVPPPADPDLPPDPATVAPDLDRTVATDLFTATEFLYAQGSAIQTGVEPGTIDPRRVAVIRGRVLDRSGDALPGVEITIHRHPELGGTKSRADGAFDLAVNGGGPLTVAYEKQGYLPAQRQVEAPWRDYVFANDVVLVELDPETTVVLTDHSAIQVARGGPVTDDDGTRRATLLVPPFTLAELEFADREPEPLASFTVRATEYSVGPTGPLAMPAALPANTGYTYAVELSADEAISAGASRVLFSDPLALYLENFLDFPVGGIVPAGYYDRELAAWVPSDNGRVVEVLSVDGGSAVLDVDGSGLPADPEALDELGVTPEELAALAGLYSAGQSLWRVPVTHFTPWDCNWPYGPPDDADPPPDPDDSDDDDDDGDDEDEDDNDDDGNDEDEDSDDEDDNDCENGSIIECQSQVLREVLPINGSRMTLHYGSDRVVGRGTPRQLNMRVSGPTVAPSLRQIVLDVSVAGRRFSSTFAPAPDLRARFEWDGRDGYGRLVQGATPITVTTTYKYQAFYYGPAEFRQSFSRFPTTGGVQLRANRLAGEVDVARTSKSSNHSLVKTLGNLDWREIGLGGWSLSNHHWYDPNRGMLYYGHGDRRSASRIGSFLVRVAGTGETDGEVDDGGNARDASLNFPWGLAVGPDGGLYVADTDNHRVRRIDPDGLITTVAGDGESCDGGGGTDEIVADQREVREIRNVVAQSHDTGCGDGGPATEAHLSGPAGVAVGLDGRLYIADTGNSCVRRIEGDGTITTVAGNCEQEEEPPQHIVSAPSQLLLDCEEEICSALDVTLRDPIALAVAPDGGLYITDEGDQRVYFVGADGLITVAAGGGDPPDGVGDGLPATEAALLFPSGLALTPDGELLIADFGNDRVRRVGRDGVITTVAGNGSRGFTGDGGPATEARLDGPAALAVLPDGSFYVSDVGNNRIRFVSSGGIISTFAGTGEFSFGTAEADGTPVLAADLGRPLGMVVLPDGNLAYSDFFDQTIESAAPDLPGFTGEEIFIPSPDSDEVFVFDPKGRHLRTLYALTGAELLSFGYDSLGLLTSVTDAYGNVTTIERDGSGKPLAIVAPFGQRTVLGLDGAGYLASVADPEGVRAYTFTYDQGLLTGLTDPNGQQYELTYDLRGRLIRDDDPADGFKALQRTDRSGPGDYRVSLTTSGGRTRAYDVRTSRYSQTKTTTDSFGGGPAIRTTERVSGGWHSVTTRPDGTLVTEQRSPDPIWGAGKASADAVEIRTPSGLAKITQVSRELELEDPEDPFSTVSRATEFSVNGRVFTSTYDAMAQNVTLTTPTGRSQTSQLDELGRVTSTQLGNRAPVELGYDGQGRVVEVRQGAGADTRISTLQYDADGRLAAVIDPLSRVVSYTYDALGRVSRQTLPDGRSMLFSYDAAGNLLTIAPPDRPPHTFVHTSVSQVSGYTPPAAGTESGQKTFVYDSDRKLVSIHRADGGVVALDYEVGGVSSITTPRGATTISYLEGTALPGTLTAPDGGVVKLTYDGSLWTSSSWSGAVAGSVERTFNNDFRIVQETVDGGHGVGFAYDADGLLTQAGDLIVSREPTTGQIVSTELGQVATATSYNQFGEPVGHSAAAGGVPVWESSYSRDKRGRITQKTESVGGTTDVYSYTYDLGGRLTRVDKNSNLFAEYSYDANGNRVAANGPFGAATASYDDQDRLLTYGDAVYEYTADGELSSKTENGLTIAFQYDALGQLLSVQKPDGILIEYLIDGSNRRIGKRVNGTLVSGFLYRSSLQPAAQLDGSGNVVTQFVYGSGANVPDYMIKGGETFRLITDHLGSPRLVINVSTGDVAQRMDYDEYGRILADTNPGFQPFGFSGGLYDPQTGLVRLGARDYDVQVGRWTTRDPAGFFGGYPNLYEYVGSDPINATDPLGLAPGDQRFGLPKDFWRWYHRQVKQPGDPDLNKPDAQELFDEWKRLGKPDAEGKPTEQPRDEPSEVEPTEPTEYCPVEVPGSQVPYLVAAGLGVAIIVGTLVEDVLTGGVGILDDPVTLGIGAALILGTTAADPGPGGA